MSPYLFLFVQVRSLLEAHADPNEPGFTAILGSARCDSSKFEAKLQESPLYALTEAVLRKGILPHPLLGAMRWLLRYGSSPASHGRVRS